MSGTWGFQIWIYLWLAGMAAGAYCAAFLADQFGRNKGRHLTHFSVYLLVPLAIIGALLLLLDLGHPLRFWHLFLSFRVTSPMSIGTWILSLAIGIGILMIVLYEVTRRLRSSSHALDVALNWLYWLEFFISVFLMSYTGVLLATSNQPFWMSTYLLPPLFVASAASTGVALLVATFLLSGRWKDLRDTTTKLIKTDAVIIVIEALILVGYMFWLTRSPVVGAGTAFETLTTGSLAVGFWIVVLLAILIPFALDVAHWSIDIRSDKLERGILALSSICIIVGGLMLRAVWVIAGQI